jgi:hypothetical protein
LAVAAVFGSHSSFAQTPSPEDLHKLILALQVKQAELAALLEESNVARKKALAALEALQVKSGPSGNNASEAVAVGNYRLGLTGSNRDMAGHGASAHLEGSVAIPLAKSVGFQIDALAGGGKDKSISGAAAHLF